ncbi:hypothetical protein EYC80_000072 [Monilinia laxa]|uniref:Ubiquitin 3 binding protein But2 C-terminal domain-containing protein n=1 Tax=Monilinia laxa TaxID=61186 RepID=A0A5N6K9I4_MONLA|nr:hypothetical protein EYC80_000072 [Monilinia laxa]
MFATSLLLLNALAATAFSASIPTVEKRASAASSFISDVQWKVSGFTRPCTATVCTYNFTISVIPSTGPAVNIPCLYNDTATTPPASITPQTHSYSALSCTAGTTWQVNWGYNPNGDFAVMTIVDTAKGQDAFFGWNGIAAGTAFEDKGPNAVYALGTFS